MLTIDVGNSRIKWALFSHGEIIQSGHVGYKLEDAEVMLTALSVGNGSVIISSVSTDDVLSRLIDLLERAGCSELVVAKTLPQQCGVLNAYEKFDSLGVDRWLAMIAAYNLLEKNENSPVCVLDCGTAVTLDLVLSNGEHQGGLIMPGLHTLAGSLSNSTRHIEENPVQKFFVSESMLENDTEAAVTQGCQQLWIEGLSACMQKQVNTHKGLCVVLTGGDAEYLSPRLKVQHSYEPFLIHKGLYLYSQSNMGL